MSPSLNQFMNDLEVKFKDDGSRHSLHRHGPRGALGDDGGQHMMTPSNTPFPSGANPQTEDDIELYVSTSAMMEIDTADGHLPQFLHLRRSSLSEEEQQALEL